MVFIGVVGASRSTAKGAMLVMSIVAARNIFERYRAVLEWWPDADAISRDGASNGDGGMSCVLLKA